MLGIHYAAQASLLSKEAYVVIENPINGKSTRCLAKFSSNQPITTISSQIADEISLEVVSKKASRVNLDGPVKIYFNGRYCYSSVRVSDEAVVIIGLTTMSMF